MKASGRGSGSRSVQCKWSWLIAPFTNALRASGNCSSAGNSFPVRNFRPFSSICLQRQRGKVYRTRTKSKTLVYIRAISYIASLYFAIRESGKERVRLSIFFEANPGTHKYDLERGSSSSPYSSYNFQWLLFSIDTRSWQDSFGKTPFGKTPLAGHTHTHTLREHLLSVPPPPKYTCNNVIFDALWGCREKEGPTL